MGRIKDEAKKHEYYKIIRTETNRLSGIVNKILNFSKIEGGRRNYKFTETDLNELVDQIIKNYSHHFKVKGMEYSVNTMKNLPLVKVDAEAVTDAMINLIDNAIKYGGENKRIEISTGISLRMVYIDLKDHGIGIDPKHHKLVFDKFYRVTSGNLAHKAKGTGIGLSIVKHIMEAHKGEVSLRSVPGEGSIFRLSFPIDYSKK
jgi:two-component system phosphate regulon sensor histidine kinase PhoR